MANEVTTNAASGLGAIAAGLQRAKKQMPSFGGKAYLKFAKDGEWSVGRGGDDLTNERVVVNVESLKSGYVCWTNHDKKKNEKLGEEMVLASLGSVDPASLKELGWEWKAQQSFDGRFIDGDKKEVTYTTSSIGGLEAFDGVLDAVMARLGEGEETFIFPVVELQTDWYEHSQWGKTYKPVLDVVAWVNEDGDPEGSAKKAAKKVTKKKEVEAEEPETEDEDEPEAEEPPVKRRRR